MSLRSLNTCQQYPNIIPPGALCCSFQDALPHRSPAGELLSPWLPGRYRRSHGSCQCRSGFGFCDTHVPVRRQQLLGAGRQWCCWVHHCRHERTNFRPFLYHDHHHHVQSLRSHGSVLVSYSRGLFILFLLRLCQLRGKLGWRWCRRRRCCRRCSSCCERLVPPTTTATTTCRPTNNVSRCCCEHSAFLLRIVSRSGCSGSSRCSCGGRTTSTSWWTRTATTSLYATIPPPPSPTSPASSSLRELFSFRWLFHDFPFPSLRSIKQGLDGFGTFNILFHSPFLRSLVDYNIYAKTRRDGSIFLALKPYFGATSIHRNSGNNDTRKAHPINMFHMLSDIRGLIAPCLGYYLDHHPCRYSI